MSWRTSDPVPVSPHRRRTVSLAGRSSGDHLREVSNNRNKRNASSMPAARSASWRAQVKLLDGSPSRREANGLAHRSRAPCASCGSAARRARQARLSARWLRLKVAGDQRPFDAVLNSPPGQTGRPQSAPHRNHAGSFRRASSPSEWRRSEASDAVRPRSPDGGPRQGRILGPKSRIRPTATKLTAAPRPDP